MPKTGTEKQSKSQTDAQADKKVSKRASKKIWKLTYEELYNIVVSIFVIALIFAYNPTNPIATIGTMPRAFLAVAIIHSLYLAAQKTLARRLGCVAFYKLWLPGLVVGLLLMVVGIKPIILVGAVSLTAYKFSRFGFKSRQMSLTEIGWVGVSGPLVAMFLTIVFKSLVLPYLAFVSGMIALFSLLPIKPLDGGKVFLWNPIYWLFLVFALVLILTPAGLMGYITSLYGAAKI